MSSKLISSKSKIRISITIIPALDKMLEKVSINSGKSKSSLIEQAISQYFKNKLEKDLEMLSKINFEDLPSEDNWLEIQSNYEK